MKLFKDIISSAIMFIPFLIVLVLIVLMIIIIKITGAALWLIGLREYTFITDKETKKDDEGV